MTIKVQSLKIWMNLEKIGVKSLFYNQSQIHSDYDSAESIGDSDLEDGQSREMLASPLYIREREGNSGSSRKPRASGKPDAMFSFDREPTLKHVLSKKPKQRTGRPVRE